MGHFKNGKYIEDTDELVCRLFGIEDVDEFKRYIDYLKGGNPNDQHTSKDRS